VHSSAVFAGVDLFALKFYRDKVILSKHVYTATRLVLKLFQCFVSHVTTSETEINLFQPLGHRPTD